jgi:16S rRNA (cytidine1402-2'-O)-methyltransferase
MKHSQEPARPGTLYLVATPIGNLEDISFRALNTLKTVDVVAAEDTRRTRKLLSYYDISARLISYREHNKVFQGRKLLEMLQQGQSIAVCSDAGMPVVSDPGEDFVRLCIENGVPVTVIPGPNAALCALVLSGLSANTFLYLGFITRKAKKKAQFIESLKDLPHTLIFYESPGRVVQLLKDLAGILGDRKACVAREISKIHEEFQRGPLSELIEKMDGTGCKGEFVVVVEGAGPGPGRDYFDPEEAAREVQLLEAQGTPRKKAIKEVANRLHTSKRAVYRLFIEENSRD